MSYNERFCFDNPLGQQAACRSTRYRAKRRRGGFDLTDSTSFSDYEPPQSEPEEEVDLPTFSSEDLDFLCLERGSTDDRSDHTGIVHEDCEIPVDDDEHDELFDHESHPQSLEVEFTSCINSDNEVDEDASSLLPTAVETSAPIYEGSDISIHASSVLMLQFKVRHDLTEQALTDLFQLIRLHCPRPNNFISSIYQFKKQFQNLYYPIVLHYFCSSCYYCFEDEKPSVSSCPNSLCGANLEAKEAISSFIEVSISLQLKTILERKFVSLLKWKFIFIFRKGYHVNDKKQFPQEDELWHLHGYYEWITLSEIIFRRVSKE